MIASNDYLCFCVGNQTCASKMNASFAMDFCAILKIEYFGKHTLKFYHFCIVLFASETKIHIQKEQNLTKKIQKIQIIDQGLNTDCLLLAQLSAILITRMIFILF